MDLAQKSSEWISFAEVPMGSQLLLAQKRDSEFPGAQETVRFGYMEDFAS